MGREGLEGLCVSPKPAASRKINKRIISHPVSYRLQTRSSFSDKKRFIANCPLSYDSVLDASATIQYSALATRPFTKLRSGACMAGAGNGRMKCRCNVARAQ